MTDEAKPKKGEMYVFGGVEVVPAETGRWLGRDPGVTRSGGGEGRAVGGGGSSRGGIGVHAVDTEQLSDSLVGFIDNVRDMLAKVSQTAGEFRVEKVEVAAQINASGKVGFLGSGAEASGGASLKIVLERKKDEPAT